MTAIASQMADAGYPVHVTRSHHDGLPHQKGEDARNEAERENHQAEAQQLLR